MRKTSLLIAGLLSAALAGCWGGGSSNDTAAPSTNTPISTSEDGFSQSVAGIVGTSDDSADPASIEQIMQTAPDNAEPMAIKL